MTTNPKKIVIVSPMAPSRLGLAEYTLNIVAGLVKQSDLEIVVLADRLPEPQPELIANRNLTIKRCWTFNSLQCVPDILRAIKREKPDVVWYDLLFTTFADNRLKVFLSLLLPALTRAVSPQVTVTLHHLFECIERKDTKFLDLGIIDEIAGFIATKLILLANTVTVTMSKYEKILKTRYRANNVVKISHGFLGASDRCKAKLTNKDILVFGKFGTYKRLESAIRTHKLVQKQHPDARLIIAGTDHPSTPGYLDDVKDMIGDNPTVEFRGYIPEEKLVELFTSVGLLLLPYTSATGASGVAHLACSYGLPIVSYDVEDLRQVADEEDMAIVFARMNEAELAGCVSHLFSHPNRKKLLGEYNYSAAQRGSFQNVSRTFLNLFGLEVKEPPTSKDEMNLKEQISISMAS